MRILWKPPAPPPRDRLDPSEAGLPRIEGVWELVAPNVRGIFKGAYYRTNSAGFRGPELPLAKASDVFRIAITGDSVTMGSGVREEEAYPARLEALLNERRGDRRYEVLNLGIGGLNGEVAVLRLEQIGMPFDPDILVYGCTVNDVEGRRYRRFERDPRQRPLQRILEPSPSRLWQLLRPRLDSLRDVVWPADGSYLDELHHNYFENPGAWEDFLSGLDRLAALGRTHRSCAVLFQHSGMYYLNWLHPFTRFYERIAEAAEERELRVVPSFPFVRGRDATSLWVSRFDRHPNAAGHELLAEALYAGLEQLPAHCWDRR